MQNFDDAPRIPLQPPTEPEASPGAPAVDDDRGALEPLEPKSRRPTGPVSRRVHTTGNADLDQRIADLVRTLGEAVADGPAPRPADLDLAREMISSVVGLTLQRATRDELKLVNAAVKEFAYAFRVFAPYRGQRKVSIFGSARTLPGEPAYIATLELARLMAARDWMVITGAGPGIMAAGHEGAGAEHSFGANIRLPALNPANVYIAQDGKLINFKYFFTRKVTFIKESNAFVLLPGGWGTLDEAFELLTLVQTGKTDLHPIVLLEPEGSDYWQHWFEFSRDDVLGRGLISASDLSIFRIAHSPAEAMAEIETFYRNYESARFVGDRLILRLKRAPAPEALARLNADFADLLEHGTFEIIPPTPPEQREHDSLEAARLAFYPRHAYGRIRQLIDALNQL